MIKIECFKTMDGIVHESFRDAKKHAESRYGDQLTKMAHELVRINKYSEMTEKLDAYSGSMTRLMALRNDLDLYSTEEQ